MNTHRMMAMAVGVALAAMTGSAQWTGQLLNSVAVTDGSGKIVILDDGGGSWNNGQVNTSAAAFDNANEGTFYDANMAQGAWAGFELESPKVITRVRYRGRGSQIPRVSGTLIQGANTSDFSDAVTLWTLQPPAGWNGTTWVDVLILSPAVTNSFTFVRFYCPLPSTFGGNFSGMEFYGADPLSDSVGLPATPSLSFDGCINWRMNLCWAGNATSVILYEIQRKIAHEDDFSLLAYVCATSGTTRYVDMTFMMYQDTEYRVRAINQLGESSWTTPVTGLARNGATGRWIGTQGTYGGGMTGDKAFDGNVATYLDAPSSTGGVDVWAGLDFGSEKTLTAIRYVPRLDFAARMNGGWFEAADNPDFTNPTFLFTVPATPVINGVTEASLGSPVTARYARYCSPNSSPSGPGWGNVAEVEFIETPAPRKPQGLAVTSSDITNAFAVLTWPFNVGSLMSSTMVYRATSPGGPYDLMTPDGLVLTELTWTDTTVSPSIRYYYKVASLLNASPDPIESLSDYVSYIPCMRIERDWNNLTHIKPGMTLLGTHYTGWGGNPGVINMFNGNLNDHVDLTTVNPAIGVNLGKPYCIQFMRHAGRSGNQGRLNGAELRGSNNPNYESEFTRLATFANVLVAQLVTQQTVNQEPFQYIFIQRPDALAFNGNINELELYGWDPDVTASAFSAPDSLRYTFQSDGVKLDWDVNTAQDFYRIQRSADGGVTWDVLGVAHGGTFTDTDIGPIVGQRVLYRVDAVRGTIPNEEVAYSDDLHVIPYFASTGNGLTAVYYTNFFRGYNTSEAFAGTFIEPTPDWQTTTAIPIRTEIPNSAENVRVVWYGSLTVPFDGDWTFYLTSDDGAALRFDDTFIINSWAPRGATTDQVTLSLTGGVYTVRADYFNGGTARAMKLEWGGAVSRTVIPSVQFEPLPLPSEDGVFWTTGEWSGRTVTSTRLGYHTQGPDGSITIRAAGGDINGTAENYYYACQPVSGDFIFDAKVNLPIMPGRPGAKAMLMVREALPSGSPFLAVSCIATNLNGKFIVKQRIPPVANITDALPTWQDPSSIPLETFYLRVKRTKGVFTFLHSPTGASWTPLDYEYTDSDEVFSRNVYVGMAVCDPVDTTPLSMFQTATFSKISLKKLNGTILLLK